MSWRKSFVSIEAFLALLFAVSAFALVLPLFAPKPSFLGVYQHQLVQDLMETSLKNEDTFKHIIAFAGGSQSAKTFLHDEYSQLLSRLGDYCLEVQTERGILKVSCSRAPLSKASVSRMVFDGRDFFELTFSLGFYSS